MSEDQLNCKYQVIPICPYCSKEYKEYIDADGIEDSSWKDVKCESCNKNYRIISYVKVLFCTKMFPCHNGEDHQFSGWEVTGLTNCYMRICEWCRQSEIKFEKVENE